MNPSYGVIVGRFQVHELHPGHLELFRQVMARHSRVIVFVGISPVRGTKRNPLDFETRKLMIQERFPEFIVLPLADEPTDEIWSRNLDKEIRKVADWNAEVTLYGGRDSFVPHYFGSHKPMELALDPASMQISGADIRAKLTNKVMASADFRAGMIYAASNRPPCVVPCVDIVIYHKSADGSREFLLGKRSAEDGYRFVGGHAEIKTQSYEMDARNESMEEAGLDTGPLQYIGSTLVPDWRYEQEESKIKTAIYAAEVMTLHAVAGDDIDQVKWFKEQELAENLLIPTHRPLFRVVQNWLRSAKDAAAKTAV